MVRFHSAAMALDSRSFVPVTGRSQTLTSRVRPPRQDETLRIWRPHEKDPPVAARRLIRRDCVRTALTINQEGRGFSIAQQKEERKICHKKFYTIEWRKGDIRTRELANFR